MSYRLCFRFALIATFICICLMTQGCSEDADRDAFRQTLIDKALNDETRQQGDAFLAQNRQNEGVVVLNSGVQFRQLQVADDPQASPPGRRDRVTVHYEGRRIDGHVFDSSYARGAPSTFPVDALIPGWSEILVQMRPGEIREVYIPADLAYGARSPSPDIPANSALIFIVELLQSESISHPASH
ncbi:MULTISPECIES: FKBP-type peptidyl-prolyl cis-trans isomerase [Nitrincola]|uniref:Peptidyl-prolyl cis-trans isomerase n=1 Tax=Nitrincola nitratireducens TaxID=1229521 RepID=W9V0K8_9GAMM|nr:MULTISPECIES: FKBP-type peptidyl-prolyl cis-trans isomerase [Nitrincola]EXJ12849.1 Outer membrane protein MIP precursor [Nitrincola nitratireducens]